MLFLLKTILSGLLIALASSLAKKYPGPAGIVVAFPFTTFLALAWMKYEGVRDSDLAIFLQSVGWIILGGAGIFFLTPYLIRQGWSFGAAFALGLMALGLGTWLTARFVN